MAAVSVSNLGERVTVRLTEQDARALDEIRGRRTRATALRSLIREAAARRSRSTTPPSRREALALLADQARFDRSAAVELVRTLDTDEQLARLRGITADDRPDIDDGSAEFAARTADDGGGAA
jgi:hypothetical protein